jgi:hypothetical protein
MSTTVAISAQMMGSADGGDPIEGSDEQIDHDVPPLEEILYDDGVLDTRESRLTDEVGIAGEPGSDCGDALASLIDHPWNRPTEPSAGSINAARLANPSCILPGPWMFAHGPDLRPHNFTHRWERSLHAPGRSRPPPSARLEAAAPARDAVPEARGSAGGNLLVTRL